MTQIPIQNLYYLLCYAWDVTDQQNKVKVDGDECHSLENLLAKVLIGACGQILRRGLVREYRFGQQEVDGVRGKIDVAQTLQSGKYRHGHTICYVDELSQNVLINQIIYSSVKRLASLDSVDDNVREKLKICLRKFPRLTEIRITNKTFDRIKLHRNNRFYFLVLHVCKLVHQSTLPMKNSNGKYEFIDFTQDDFRMNAIFERFLMNFCKRHFKEEFPEIHREYIDFQLSPFGMMFKQASKALPTMETDVTLYNPSTGEKTIIDAKYYHETLVSKYGGQGKVRREHLSQIISYLMNQEDSNQNYTLSTRGVLVYPTIDEDYDFSYRYRDTEHCIHVRTINLNQDWRKIEERVKEIICPKQ